MTTARSTYRMLGNADLWATAADCHRLLTAAGVPYAVFGGVAVSLHGYRRNTVNLEVIVRPEDAAAVKSALEAGGLTWVESDKEFRTAGGIAVQFLTAGERAGGGASILLPDPAEPHGTVDLEGLPTLRLSKLVEIKLACGAGNLRRTHKDFADVVELIAVCGLDSSFTRFLHQSVRPEFRRLVRHARGKP